MHVTNAIETIKGNGFKVTDKRKKLLKIFSRNNKYLTAKEVLEEMQAVYPRVSFDTIYRNLALFIELDILEVTELDGEKLFRYTCDVDDHHHHFICLGCGSTKVIDVCPMEYVTEDLGDYDVRDHKFEIYGKCPRCKKGAYVS